MQLARKKFWEADSERARDSYLRLAWRERCEPKARRDYRNGCYLRSFSTRLRTVRVRIARSRERAFLRQSIEAFHGRAEDVMILIRFVGDLHAEGGLYRGGLHRPSQSARRRSKLTCDFDQGN